jgi:tetratricopeptide (TPR) repeat protein
MLLVLNNHKRLGTICFYSGDWDQAREHYGRAQAMTSQGAPQHALLLDLGRMCLAEGAWDLARSYLQQCSTISGRSKQLILHKVAESCLAELDILTGQPGAAHARLLPLQEQAGREEQVVATFLLSRLAWAAIELGRMEEASMLLDQALGRQRAHGYRPALVDTLRVQGLLHRQLGEWAPAVSALEEGLSLARHIGYPYGEARLLHAYGQLHAEAGETDPARKQLEAALAIFHRLGARKDIEQTEQLLATHLHPHE